jgi:hypothetical protein
MMFGWETTEAITTPINTSSTQKSKKSSGNSTLSKWGHLMYQRSPISLRIPQATIK